MAESLFITTTDVKKLTVLDGNLDNDKFIQFLWIAQEIHIQNILGSDLYEKLQSDIAGSTLTGDYQTLVETYIKPALVHLAVYEYLPFAPFNVSNKGVFKHTSEAAVVADRDDIEDMRNAAKNHGDYYTLRLKNWLRANENSFPEYNTNTDGDVYPDSNPMTGSWYLGEINEDYKGWL